jgi:dihydroflavonol-4-reductase
VIESLRRGYRVRTTVRDLKREPEVRAAISKEIDAGDRLSFAAADLNSDDGWREVVAGCDHVLHVASPFPPKQPDAPMELITPAREGTLRVLRAALDEGVGRIVVTSSVAAISARDGASCELTEEDWSDPDSERLTPYARSKTAAELAAWELVDERGARERLAVITPGAILGPVLSQDNSFSIQMVERLMKGEPGTPRIGFSIVDVRDVAEAHLLAMTTPAAGGERFIITGPFQWFSDIAEILRDRLGEEARKVPKRRIPDFLVRIMGLFDPSIKSISRDLGKRTDYSRAKAERILGWTPRDVGDTVEDTARSLIREGVV